VLDDFNESYKVPHIHPPNRVHKYFQSESGPKAEIDDGVEELAEEEEE
jgi:hypothetical protein